MTATVITHQRGLARLARSIHGQTVVHILLGVFAGVFLLSGAVALLVMVIIAALVSSAVAAGYGLTAANALAPPAKTWATRLATATQLLPIGLAIFVGLAALSGAPYDRVPLAGAIAFVVAPIVLMAACVLVASANLPQASAIARSGIGWLAASMLLGAIGVVYPRLYIQSLAWLGLPFLGFVSFIFGAVRLVNALERCKTALERADLGTHFD